jgi:D-glycero-alpha-D-manno-heptose-7-phosphate kinase
MLFYTGILRTGSDVAQSYAGDLESRSRQLRLLKDLVEESIAILIGGEDILRFGQLLHEAWQAKRSLSAKVSNAEVDGLYEQARAAGALGGKLTGAGGGGFFLLFAPPQKQPAIRAALDNLIHVPFAFDAGGSQIIFYEPGVDYQEAEAARQKRPAVAFKEFSEVA